MAEALLIREDDNSLSIDVAAVRRFLAQFGPSDDVPDEETPAILIELLKLPLKLKR